MPTLDKIGTDHIPAPAEHAERTEWYQAGGSATQPPRLVVGDPADPVRWIACAQDDTVEVRR